jgi:hypothetical protein
MLPAEQIKGKYMLTVIWATGDFWTPYGLHYFAFEHKEEAEAAFKDEDWTLRRHYEYNWLYQGHKFWTARILVILTQPDGYTERGWQGFTLSDEEVIRECAARELDAEACLADRAKLRESRDVPVFAGWKKE